MTYWYMKMKQGSRGEDFAKELWQQGFVGVLFGTWRIDDVLDEQGKPDPNKLKAEAIEKRRPQPQGIPFDDAFLWAPRVFLLKVSVGDRVVVVFDDAIHIGTIGKEFLDDPNGPRGPYKEYFKCRTLQDKKEPFHLWELPASYRLVGGRRAIQRIHAFKELIRLLDDHHDAQGVREALLSMPTPEWLGTRSDKQWEVLCDRYLRDKVGLRSLLLAVGGTLKDLDIYGVSQEGKRVLAQCKNHSEPWKRERLMNLVARIPRSHEDHLYCFLRGGVEDGREGLGCRVVDGETISAWLDRNPEYLQQLKTM
jgi:hypothetical protein